MLRGNNVVSVKYEVSVRQVRRLPPASFRFHLTMDTLALGYVIPAIRAYADFHPLDNAHAEHTQQKSPDSQYGCRGFLFSINTLESEAYRDNATMRFLNQPSWGVCLVSIFFSRIRKYPMIGLLRIAYVGEIDEEIVVAIA